MMFNEVPATYEKDGLQYCKKCNTPRQAVIELPAGLFMDSQPTRRIVGCLCKCLTEEHERREEENELRKRKEKLDRLTEAGFHENSLRECTFAAAAEDSENIEKARQYVDKFGEFKKEGIGLMFFGNVGNGKTFTAACIANALLEKLIPVCMTTTAKILGMDFDERENFIRSLHKFQLLIIDDFGIERTSTYATEQIYTIIDERYKSGLPMIITTNLLPSDLEQEEDLNKKRIYSRVLEMCLPVKFTGESRRDALRKEKLAEARKIFSA